jgi:hypothetical protein
MIDSPSRTVARRLPEPPVQMLVAMLVIGIGAVLITWLGRSGAASPEQYAIFPRLFVFNDNVQAWAMLAGVVFASRVQAVQSSTMRLAERVGARPGLTCALAFAAMAAGARFVYLAHPLSMDEYAPLMQANAFAQGRLAAHYPLPLLDGIVSPSFRGSFMLVDPCRRTGPASRCC